MKWRETFEEKRLGKESNSEIETIGVKSTTRECLDWSEAEKSGNESRKHIIR
jgi:hypothetical protein